MNIHIIFSYFFFVVFCLNQYNFCAEPSRRHLSTHRNSNIMASRLNNSSLAQNVRVNDPYGCQVIDPKYLQESEESVTLQNEHMRLTLLMIAYFQNHIEAWYAGPEKSSWRQSGELMYVQAANGRIGVLNACKRFYIWDELQKQWVFVPVFYY